MDKQLLETYSDYLIASFSYTTATGLSIASEGTISHDRITRFLNSEDFTSKGLWRLVKPVVRAIQNSEGVLIIDDTIEEKPSTDVNEIITWHYDHCKKRNMKGINLVSCIYLNNGTSVPVAFEIVHKTKTIIDQKTGKEKCVSEKTKNEQYREMINLCEKNGIEYSYVLNDVWYSASQNMVLIKEELKKDFIMPLRSNRKVAVSKKDKLNGRYVQIGDLEIKENTTMQIYIAGAQFPLLFIKQVFRNEDGSTGVLHLVSSDLTLTYESMTTIYQKRFKVEEYHKSLKQHVSLCKSPTKVVRTQSNHVFAAIYAFYKLEFMSMISKVNRTALMRKIYMGALKAAKAELLSMKLAINMKF